MPATRAGGRCIGGRSRRASPYPVIDRAPHASRCGARRFLGRGRPVDRGAKMACGRRRVVSILAPKRRSAEPSMLRTPPLRAPARVSPIPGALQYRADRPRAGHLGAFLPPARRDRVPRALLIR
ncbi:acetate permease [Burkholderia mallei]|nr:acetate permease [Burkholderia mallei]RKN96605.1 acetate permease [Burkholderia mallei]RKO11048.1 acetate permease [Burkholderia mallei]RKO18238.1 acetate permease [Burkholderia mallei]RKO29024.1 acetate permease [Burkholderia mallei]